MVECTCKTPTALVYEITAVREALPKRMPRVACVGQSSEPRRIPRFCSMGFNSPISRVRIPPCVVKRIASGLVLSFGTLKDGTRKSAFVCENVFNQKSVIIPHREKNPAFPSEPCKSEPCLRADTALSPSAPKGLFPRRAGSAQAPSRRFYMNVTEATQNFSGGDYRVLILPN